MEEKRTSIFNGPCGKWKNSFGNTAILDGCHLSQGPNKSPCTLSKNDEVDFFDTSDQSTAINKGLLARMMLLFDISRDDSFL
jgi:hypothetical protein